MLVVVLFFFFQPLSSLFFFWNVSFLPEVVVELTYNLEKNAYWLRLKLELWAISCIVFGEEKNKKFLEIEEMLRVLKELVDDYFQQFGAVDRG